jgi:hypothetical protein
MLRLVERSETPPDLFTWKCPHCVAPPIRTFDKDSWYRQIREHYINNEHELPEEWKEQAQARLCERLPPGWCLQENGQPNEKFVDTRISIEDILHGTKVLGTFIASGMPTVPQEQIESRAATCATCYFNIPIPGCAPCVGLANLVASIAGNIKTEADPFLKSCAVCRCANEAQTRLPIEILKKGVTPEMMELFPAEFCWKRRELEQLTETIPLTGAISETNSRATAG